MLDALQLLTPEEQVEYPEAHPDEQLAEELPEDEFCAHADWL